MHFRFLLLSCQNKCQLCLDFCPLSLKCLIFKKKTKSILQSQSPYFGIRLGFCLFHIEHSVTQEVCDDGK